MTGPFTRSPEPGPARQAVLVRLGLLSSHPRHARVRFWLWAAAMVLPTVVLLALVVNSAARSFDLTELRESVATARRGFLVLIAGAAFFAALGASAILSLRMARIRHLSDRGVAFDFTGLAVLFGATLLLAIVPAVLLDAAIDPWVRLIGHLAAPLPLLLLLGAMNVAEAEQDGREASVWPTLLGILAVVPVVAGLVMLSDVLVPDPGSWEWITRHLPASLTPDMRALTVRLLSFQVLLVLGGPIWMLRGLVKRRDAEAAPPEPDWLDRLQEELKESQSHDQRPMLAREPRLRPGRSASRSGVADSPDLRYASLVATGAMSVDQVALIERFHEEYLAALARDSEDAAGEGGLSGCGLLLLAEPESGYEDTLAACSLLARLRGQRCLILAADRRRAEQFVARVKRTLDSTSLGKAFQVERLNSDSVKTALLELSRRPAASSGAPLSDEALPDMLVATRSDLDRYITEQALASDPLDHRPDEPSDARVARDLLASCEVLLVDCIERFAAEDAAAVPFLISLQRSLVRGRGGLEQCVLGLETHADPDEGDAGGEAEPGASSDGDTPHERTEIDPQSRNSAANELFHRLFEERLAEGREGRVLRLRRRAAAVGERLELIAGGPDLVEELRERIYGFIGSAGVRAAVWRRERRHLGGNVRRTRILELESLDQMPRLDASSRDCLIILPDERGNAPSAEDRAALESKMNRGRAHDHPLRVIEVIVDRPQGKASKAPLTEPRLIVLPAKDDRLHGMRYLKAASLLLDPGKPCRRALFDALGVPSPGEFREIGRASTTRPLLRVDPPDAEQRSTPNRIVYPIVWRDATCVGRDAVLPGLPGRCDSSSPNDERCIAGGSGGEVLLVVKSPRSAATERAEIDGSRSRMATWRLDGRDETQVDLAIANTLVFQNSWPERGTVDRDGRVVLEASPWTGHGIETFLPMLRLDRLTIPRDRLEQVSLANGLLLQVPAPCPVQATLLGAAAPNGQRRWTVVESQAPVLNYDASVSILVGPSRTTSSTLDEVAVREAAAGTWSSMGDATRQFLPGCTRRLAAAMGHRLYRLLDFSRVLAFWSETHQVPIVLAISPEELGSTIRNALHIAVTRSGFMSAIARDAADAAIEDRVHQPFWAVGLRQDRSPNDAIADMESRDREAIDLMRSSFLEQDVASRARRRPPR